MPFSNAYCICEVFSGYEEWLANVVTQQYPTGRTETGTPISGGSKIL